MMGVLIITSLYVSKLVGGMLYMCIQMSKFIAWLLVRPHAQLPLSLCSRFCLCVNSSCTAVSSQSWAGCSSSASPDPAARLLAQT